MYVRWHVFGEKIFVQAFESLRRKNVQDRGAFGNFGFFLGVNRRSDEVYVGTPDGVVKARAIKRLTEKARWEPEEIKEVRGVPWEPIPGSGRTEVPIRVPIKTSLEAPVIEHNFEENLKRISIKKADVEKYGHTLGMPGV